MSTLTSALLQQLLDKPVGPTTPARKLDPEQDFTRQIEIRGDIATVTVKDQAGKADESAAYEYLLRKGEDPDQWEVTGFRSGEWIIPGGQGGESNRYTFKRVAGAGRSALPLDELISAIDLHEPVVVRPRGTHGFVIFLGDMQFGKIDGDGAEGTVRRTIDCLNQAANKLAWYRFAGYDIGHVHIGWLGDHVEGFQSQGGANAWRTPLTLTEQIRLTRRVMLHAMLTFAPLAERLTMTAVPGNHGDTIRFEGKGLTRYDDSHDTESLIAVSDAAKLAPEKFGHVEFYVPDTDEMIVVVDVANTVIAHAHGHKHKPGKHMTWWSDQAFNASSPMHMADVLVEGHLHHEEVDTEGNRLFLGVPAMESESTWFRHFKGTGGAPGLLIGIAKDHRIDVRELIR